MPRLVSEHFNPRGTPKRGFETSTEALTFINEHNISKQAYLCPTCQQWHIGERQEPKKKHKSTQKSRFRSKSKNL